MTKPPSLPRRPGQLAGGVLTLPYALWFVALTACSAAGSSLDNNGAGGTTNAGGSSNGGASGAGGTARGNVNAGGGGQAGFDPHGGCDYQSFDSFREPGAVLINFDFSSSMNRDNQDQDTQFPSDPTKWKTSAAALNQLLGSLSDTVNMGLMYFPNNSNDMCDQLPNAAVAVGPLSQTRASMQSYFSTSEVTLGGGTTPLIDAVFEGHNYLHSLSNIGGQKAMLLVTDGIPSSICGGSDDDVVNNAKLALNNWGQKTFVVGLAGSADDLLSLTAAAGGTPRMQGCQPACVTPDKCCHYVAEGTDTQASLQAAFADFAAQFLSSCIFSVPKGTDPSQFDPNLVNVVVTFDGESPQVLPNNDTTGWTYTDGTHDYVEIHGEACTKLLATETKVEIALGCPTGQIQ